MSNTLSGEYCFMRLLGETLVVTHATLDLNLVVLPQQDKLKQADIIMRIQFWLNNCFEGCIALPMNRDYSTEWLGYLNNPIMFCPDEPHDVTLQVLIHSKLNAIGQGMVIVTSSHMTTDLGNGLGTIFDGNPDEILPSNLDWMGPDHFFTKPWWHRSDAGMADIVASDGADLKNPPDIIIPWEDLIPVEEQNSPSRSAEIIRPAFKPKIITND